MSAHGAAHDAKLEALFANAPTLKSWLEEMRGFARDGKGRRVVLGLTAEETLEFVTLAPQYWAERDHVPNSDVQRRYNALREKPDAARRQDARENWDHLAGNRPPQ